MQEAKRKKSNSMEEADMVRDLPTGIGETLTKYDEETYSYQPSNRMLSELNVPS